MTTATAVRFTSLNGETVTTEYTLSDGTRFVKAVKNNRSKCYRADFPGDAEQRITLTALVAGLRNVSNTITIVDL